MRYTNRTDSFVVGLVGVLVGAMMMAMLPALAAAVGDPLTLGEVNNIDERTDLKGDAKGANLQIKNTGNAGALSVKADKNALKAKAISGPVAINATASRNAVKIKVDAGQSPLTVNAAAGTAVNFSADLLDGMDSSDLRVMAAHAGGDQLESVTEVGGVVRSLSLNAPTDGVVIVNSTAQLHWGLGGGGRCSITSGTTLDTEFLQQWQSAATNGEYGQLAGTRGFEVSAGEFTVNLVCFAGLSGESADVQIIDSALTGIFIPNG